MTDRQEPEAKTQRVLLLTDWTALRGQVELCLNHGAFVVRHAGTLAEAQPIFSEWTPHLVVADMELDDGKMAVEYATGVSNPSHVPVLGLTRRGELPAQLDAIRMGVDDILPVPFVPEELLVRSIALVRRAFRAEVRLRPIQIDDLEVDVVNRTVSLHGERVELTVLEGALLYLLAGNRGRVLTREEIVDAVWGRDFVPSSNVVDRHIRTLREKLRNSSRRPRYIFTVPGRGYRFQ